MKKTVMLVCVLMCSAAAVSQAQTVLVPDFRVDNAGASVYSGQPAVQSLPGDNFTVVWVDRRNGISQIFSSIYNNGGVVIRDDYRIDDGLAGSVSTYTGAGGTTRDSSGNFFVTWLNGDGFTFNGSIRKFLPNGDPSGASVNIQESGNTPTQVIQVSKGISDKIMISYGYSGEVRYRLFDNNLVPLGNSVKVNQAQMASETGLGSDSAGNFSIAWRGTNLMYGRLYDQNGFPRGNEYPLETVESGGVDARISYNKDGHFIVVWWAGSTYAMGSIFDENGNPLSNVFYLGPLLPSPPEQYGKPSVDADDNGNFIITYEYSSLSEPKRIYGTIYDTRGLLMEVFFPVSEITIGIPFNVMETDVACLSGGRFVTTWRDGRNDSNGDIYAAILQNDHWVPQPPGNGIPSAGPLALAILAVVLATILIRSLKSRERKTSV